MSSILLSNPFVTPSPASQGVGTEPQTALAVAPSEGASGSGATGNASTFSGNGSGFGGRDGTNALIMRLRGISSLDRPFEATSGSIITAQAQEGSADPFGTNLPNVEMPDPLPTSPFLKRA